jgi:hypothetical protein
MLGRTALLRGYERVDGFALQCGYVRFDRWLVVVALVSCGRL